MGQFDFLKFNLSLRQLSLLKLATYLWETPKAREEIDHYAMKVYKETDSPIINEKKWRELSKTIVDQLNDVQLPSALMHELRNTTVFIGERLFLWFTHVTTDVEFHNRYTRKVYWTSHGIINDLKIFQDFWAKDPSFPESSSQERDAVFYSLAAKYACEDILRENLEAASQVVYDYVGFKPTGFNATMAALVTFVLATEDVNNLAEMYINAIRNTDGKGPVFLFKQCIKNNYDRAADYYYQRIKPKDRPKAIYETATRLVNAGIDLKLHHVSERTPEVLLYLLRRMTEKQKKEFLTENIIKIYNLFLNTWPYKQLCIPLLESVKNDITFFEHSRMLDSMMTVLKDFAKNRYEEYKELHQPILKHLLKTVDKASKIMFFELRDTEIFEFFKRSDFTTIKTLVNDEDLKQKRSELIDISDQMCKYLKEGEQAEKINQYMKELNFSEKEKKNFMKFLDFKLLCVLLNKGSVADVDILVKMQCATKKEIIKMKKDLRKYWNPEKVCSKLIENGNSDLLVEYLKWPYEDDEEEFEKVRSRIFSIKFIRTEFCRIWLKNQKWAVLNKESTKLLRFFLKFDEVIIWFKKEKLINDDFVKLLCDMYEGKKKPKKFLLNEIFRFCSVSEDRVNQIKAKIMKDIDWWLDSYCDFETSFLMMNEVLNWACTPDQKKNVFKRYLNSAKGASLFEEYTTMCFTSGFTENEDVKSVFISEWMALCDNTDKMKREMRKLHGRKDGDEGDLENFGVMDVFEGFMGLMDLMKKRSQ